MSLDSGDELNIVYEFTIPGDPFGKERPKFAKRGKFVSAYTPEKTVNYESKVGLFFSQKYQIEPLTSPLEMVIFAFCSIPKSLPQFKKKGILKYWIPREKKPDIDNIAKCIIDGLNSIAYVDDRQIYKLNCSKWYDITPRTVVKIIPFCPNKLKERGLQYANTKTKEKM